FALVVAAHDDEDVLDGDDENEGPEYQADDPIEVGDVRSEMITGVERCLHGVQRRRADIAVDDADRAKHELGQRFLGSVLDRNDIVRAERAVGDDGGHVFLSTSLHKDSMWNTA